MVFWLWGGRVVEKEPDVERMKVGRAARRECCDFSLRRNSRSPIGLERNAADTRDPKTSPMLAHRVGMTAESGVCKTSVQKDRMVSV